MIAKNARLCYTIGAEMITGRLLDSRRNDIM
jgi:hypothetical protein